MRQLTHGSLFAGIGGFDLGFKRAGIKTIWQVEIDEYCRRVLEKNFPAAERFTDVRECGAANLRAVDIICGGFPCQDISYAGKGAGLTGERSGLWTEMFRVICELRPRFAVVENVAALLDRGLGDILRDLAGIGYDSEWNCLPACAFGATHSRQRVFLIANPAATGWTARRANGLGEEFPPPKSPTQHSQWHREPGVRGVADGLPGRVDRLESLGNAVVPQIAEWLGRRIIECDQRVYGLVKGGSAMESQEE